MAKEMRCSVVRAEVVWLDAEDQRLVPLWPAGAEMKSLHPNFRPRPCPCVRFLQACDMRGSEGTFGYVPLVWPGGREKQYCGISTPALSLIWR